jgi:hypothetical protein
VAVAAVRLDPAERTTLAAGVLTALEREIPGSIAVLQGSLAAGDWDPWSDIDVDWEVPAGSLEHAAAQLGIALARVRPVESVRTDPAFAHSPVLCLAFVRFADTPLFWRVDVTIRQRGRGSRPVTAAVESGVDPPMRWSNVESALATVVSVVRAHLRGRDDYATTLTRRAASLVGSKGGDEDDATAARLQQIVDEAERQDPDVSALAGRVGQLVGDVFG